MALSTPIPFPAVLPRARRGTGTRTDAEITRARKLASVLDHFLVDPILGFILPGVGDVVGSLLGLYTVGVAVRRKMSPVIIARMLMNLALDAVIGIVPLAGDIADFAFKANKKNVALLETRAETGKATAKDWLVVVGAALLFGAAIGCAFLLVRAIVHAIA